jgi:WD40 repeat protein
MEGLADAVDLWEVEDGRPSNPRRLATEQGFIQALDFSRDGSRLLVAGWRRGRTVTVWNVRDGSPAGAIDTESGPAWGVAALEDGRALCFDSVPVNPDTGTLTNVRALDPVKGIAEPGSWSPGSQGWFHRFAVSRDGKRIAVAMQSGISLWDRAGKRSPEGAGHDEAVNAIAISRRGDFAVTGSMDRSLQILDLESGKARVIGGHMQRVASVALSPDETRVVSGGDDGIATLWDLKGTRINQLSVARDMRVARSVAFAPNGETIAIAAEVGGIRLWPIDSTAAFAGAETLAGSGEIGSTGYVRWHNELQLLSAPYAHREGEPGAVRVWDLDGKVKTELQAPGTICSGGTAELFATGDQQGVVRIWHKHALAVASSWKTLIGAIDVAVTRGLVIAAFNDANIRIFDADAKVVDTVPLGEHDLVSSLTVSPDEKFFLAGTFRGAVLRFELRRP